MPATKDNRESSEDLLDDEDIKDINPYEILGLEKTATDSEIKTAYRKAALKSHPGKPNYYTTTTLPSL